MLLLQLSTEGVVGQATLRHIDWCLDRSCATISNHRCYVGFPFPTMLMQMSIEGVVGQVTLLHSPQNSDKKASSQFLEEFQKSVSVCFF